MEDEERKTKQSPYFPSYLYSPLTGRGQRPHSFNKATRVTQHNTHCSSGPSNSSVKEKEKLILKDRLSNRIHQFFNTTLNPEQFDKYLKTYREPAPQVKTSK
ncbi:hypothetical protein E2C01_005729 [Portunus trituberculatus]|uniref:Uncharacterized protein n=1 Tax=Portunus trituberculatus TaxID=210409 RepID=A0A5B7CVT4_PORTR|nr:hypothetical protein [Portunus trituberculatus]